MTNSKPDTDLRIIEQIRQGDASAFRQLVEKYQDVSFSLACSILHNEHDAKDALQEAFIKVYRNLHSFRARSSFATWLYKVVFNTCLTLADKQKKQQLMEGIDIEEHEHIPAEYGTTGIDKMAASDRAKIIHRVLDRMKPQEALLLRLFYLSELEVHEISEVTGFSNSKVKVTLFRARNHFAEIFRKTFGTEIII